MGEGISDSDLSEAEERTISVLMSRQESNTADAITVTHYLDSNCEERDGEFHDRS